MRFTVTILLLAILLLSEKVIAQDTANYPKPKISLKLAVLDFPYFKHAAQAFANHREGQGMGCSCSKHFGDYIKSYDSPSMNQTVQMTKNFYGTIGYFLEKGSQALFKPEKSGDRKFLSRLSGEVASFITTGLLMTAPFGQVWLHEEFHRNALSRRNIYSVDEVWKFKGGDYVKVSNVLDEDLIQLKKQFPHEHIRMSAAGIEGEIQFSREYQMDHFFKDLNTPISGPYTFGVLGAIGYIYTTKDWQDIQETLDKMNREETSISSRDFSGHDIATWVYDLFNPFEPFQNRGLHPSGTGIDRYINPAQDFTPEMTEYINRMSKRSMINFLSPSVFGIRKIRINSELALNFALRHTLTSFGDDRQADLLLKTKFGNFAGSYHRYSNRLRNFSGIELRLIHKKINVFKNNLNIDSRLMFWNQPKNFLFQDTTASFGGALEVRVAPKLNRWYHPYLDIEAKTKGWLAGNPYQNQNVSVRVGFKGLIQ